MDIETSETNTTLIQLRQHANYWWAERARAVRREAVWKEKARQLEKDVREKERIISQQAQEIDRPRKRQAWLEQQLFGRKSEQTKRRETQTIRP